MKILFLTEYNPMQRKDGSDKARHLISELVNYTDLTYCNPITMTLPNFSDFNSIIVEGYFATKGILDFLLNTSVPVYYIIEEWFAYKGNVSKAILNKDQPLIEHEDTMAEISLCNKAKKIFVRSEIMKQHFMERYIAPEKIHLLLPGTSDPYNGKHMWKIGFAGDQALDFVLDLAAEMPDVEFRIFSIAQDEQLKKAGKNVVYYGIIPNIIEQLSLCHINILPYFNNKMNQTIPQSFSYYLHGGKPIIFSGIEDLKLWNAKHPFGIDCVRDAQAYKQAIELLFESPEMRIKMETSTQELMAIFDNKKIVKNMFQLIKGDFDASKTTLQ